MRKLTIFTLALIFVAASISLAQAADVRTFNLQQSYVAEGERGEPVIKAYAELLDAKGKTPPYGKDMFKLTVGEKAAAISDVRKFSAAGEGVAVVFMIDVSSSLLQSQFQAMSDAVSTWFDNMGANDQAALISFGDDVKVPSEFTKDRQTLRNALRGIRRGGRQTHLNEAIVQAQSLAAAEKEGLPPRRVIVALSDGVNEAPGGRTREEAVKAVTKNKIPTFFIIYTPQRLSAAVKKLLPESLNAIGEICRSSGGDIYPDGGKDIAGAYRAIHKRISDALVFTAAAAGVKTDGSPQPVRLTYTDESGKSMHADADFRFVYEAKGKKIDKRIIIAGAAALLLLFIIIIAVRKNKMGKKERLKAEDEERLRIQAEEEMLKKQAEEEERRKKLEEKEPVVIVPPVVALRFFVGTGHGAQEVEIKTAGRMRVGRSAECDLQFSDEASVSSNHCEFSYAGGVLYIRDLDSTNGTSVNGVPVSGLYRINEGDVIELGRQRLRFISAIEQAI